MHGAPPRRSSPHCVFFFSLCGLCRCFPTGQKQRLGALALWMRDRRTEAASGQRLRARQVGPRGSGGLSLCRTSPPCTCTVHRRAKSDAQTHSYVARSLAAELCPLTGCSGGLGPAARTPHAGEGACRARAIRQAARGARRGPLYGEFLTLAHSVRSSCRCAATVCAVRPYAAKGCAREPRSSRQSASEAAAGRKMIRHGPSLPSLPFLSPGAPVPLPRPSPVRPVARGRRRRRNRASIGHLSDPLPSGHGAWMLELSSG